MKNREQLIAMAQLEGKMQEIDLYEKHGGVSAYNLNLYRIIVTQAYQDGILKGYELGINDAKELIQNKIVQITMRNNKFRAKEVQKPDKEFVYGTLIEFPDGKKYIGKMRQSYTGGMMWEYIEVIEDTIGQFTGLVDSNDNEIYEHDIIYIKTGGVCYEVTWRDDLGCFCLSDGTLSIGHWL